MKDFFTYIKQNRGIILLILGCGIINIVAFALYRLPVAAVIYPYSLCVAVIIVYALVKYILYRHRHKKMVKLLSFPEDIIDSLSEYNSQTDCDYNNIIGSLIDRLNELKGLSDKKYAEMLDYYTTWVHQIKTPIASMRLTLQNEDSALSRKVSEDLISIEQYVEMVLCYLRLDSDTTDYVFRHCNTDKIIKQALRRFSSQFILKGIKLDYTTVDINVDTDEKWLGFVIEQIISNSLKYTFSGCVRIYAEEQNILCIQDTGIGIATEDLPRIFDKGYTGFNGRNDRSSSGLGLYLCKRICNNLRLGISAQSTPGVGTTVCIDLNQNHERKE